MGVYWYILGVWQKYHHA